MEIAVNAAQTQERETQKVSDKEVTSDKPWHKSVVLWVSVGIAFAVGVVYYLNKNKKFKK
ncbi:MAG: hypothetical protein WJU30_00070 [Candidatus Phytoplasma pruni]